MNKGRFITIDGSEGAGKSTQLQRIQCWLDAHGIDAWYSREPGGTVIGEKIRSLLLAPEATMKAETELLLIMAARYEHLQTEIVPRLARGQWVVCDRFNDATYAYQGYGRGLALERIAALEVWGEMTLEPDIRFILGVNPKNAAYRLKLREAAKDRFEQEEQGFFDAVTRGYYYRAQALDNAYWIDANQDMDAVSADIYAQLERLL